MVQVALLHLLRRYLQTHWRGGVKNCQRNFFSVCYYRQFNSRGTIQKDWRAKIVLSLHVISWCGTFGYKMFPATKTKKYQQSNSLWFCFLTTISERFSQCWGSGISCFISDSGKKHCICRKSIAALRISSCYPFQIFLTLISPASACACHSHLFCNPTATIFFILPSWFLPNSSAMCTPATWLVTQICFPSPFLSYAWFPVFIHSQSLQTQF